LFIAGASIAIVLAALCWAARSKERPMDRDVILRIRSFGEQARREELLPFE